MRAFDEYFAVPNRRLEPTEYWLTKGSYSKTEDTAFLRARTSLVNRGILRAEDDYYTYGDKARDGDKW